MQVCFVFRLTVLNFKRLVVILVTAFWCFNCFAQNQPFKEVSIASPTAASLGKYADIPVSMHTGIPQIAIPLYTIQEGPLQLPISLSYHAGGLKVMEPSSWVGAGWSLNAGGVITRSVQGQPDDRGYLTNVKKGHFSDYGLHSYAWVYTPGIGFTTDHDWTFDERFDNGILDGEPDLYFFNFGSYSGKFYFNDDRTAVLLPEADFKIAPLVADNIRISGFVITTSDGVKYYFGQNQLSDGNIDAVEKTQPYTSDGGLSSGSVNSAWYLNRIVSADNQFSIKLVYQKEQYSYYTIGLSPKATNDLPEKKLFYLVKNYFDGVRLSQISMSNGAVSFLGGALRQDLSNYFTKSMTDSINAEAKTLGAIEINNNNGFCKKYEFLYNYFHDNTTPLSSELTLASIDTDKKRLRLDSIQEKTCDGSLIGAAHAFKYTAPLGNASFASRRLSFAQDHWGFYNGKTSNTTLAPNVTLLNYEKKNGGDREAYWPEMNYGTLNKITYPTGGSTQLELEANTVLFNFNEHTEASTASGNVQTGPGIGQAGNPTMSFTATANPYKLTLDFSNTNGSTVGYATFAGMQVDKNNRHAEKIIQPGAGSVSFQLQQFDMISGDWATAKAYEEVLNNFQGHKTIGGLRIKNLIKFDGLKRDTTTYSYSDQNGKSTGVLYSRPTYVQIYRDSTTILTSGLMFQATNQSEVDGFAGLYPGFSFMTSAGNLRPMETSQGNHIGYNEIKVSQRANGYSIYRYYGSNLWDQNLNDVCVRALPYYNSYTSYVTNVPFWPVAPPAFDFKRGELKTESHFAEGGQIVKLVSYYPVYTQNPVTTPAYIADKYWGSLFYNLSTAKKTVMTVVTDDYSGSQTLRTIDSSFFESLYHAQLTRRVGINSKGQSLETRYQYAFDYVPAGCTSLPNCFSSYASSVTSALNKFNLQRSTCTNNGSQNCKWFAYQQYRRDLSLARNTYLSCRQSNYTNASNAFKTAHDNAKSAADAVLKPILDLQDMYINAPVEVSTWKGGNLIAASFTLYDYGTNPATALYPSKIRQLNPVSLSTTFSQSAISGNTLSRDSRYTDETTLKYDKGNLVEVTRKDGVITSYVYGFNNAYPVAKAVGISYSSISASAGLSQTVLQNPTSDAALLTELNKIRQTFPLALVNTYSYRTLIGISSEINARLLKTTYDFDALGRLTVVRDQNGNVVKKYAYNYAGQVPVGQ